MRWEINTLNFEEKIITNYRKIYEQHYGKIPKDSAGRSYEIHHIDGNRSNNSPDNLKAISIQEHYDIHYAQKDWYACLRIAEKMKLSPKEISELATTNNLKRVENGSHPFLTRLDGTNLQTDKVIDGSHPFLKRLDGTSVASDQVENGSHPFLTRLDGTSLQTDRIRDGSHNFITNNPNSNIVKCPYCPKEGGEINMKRYHFDNCKFK